MQAGHEDRGKKASADTQQVGVPLISASRPPVSAQTLYEIAFRDRVLAQNLGQAINGYAHYLLAQGKAVSIGRGAENDVTLAWDQTVSGGALRVTTLAKGDGYKVEALGSSPVVFTKPPFLENLRHLLAYFLQPKTLKLQSANILAGTNVRYGGYEESQLKLPTKSECLAMCARQAAFEAALNGLQAKPSFSVDAKAQVVSSSRRSSAGITISKEADGRVSLRSNSASSKPAIFVAESGDVHQLTQLTIDRLILPKPGMLISIEGNWLKVPDNFKNAEFQAKYDQATRTRVLAGLQRVDLEGDDPISKKLTKIVGSLSQEQIAVLADLYTERRFKNTLRADLDKLSWKESNLMPNSLTGPQVQGTHLENAEKAEAVTGYILHFQLPCLTSKHSYCQVEASQLESIRKDGVGFTYQANDMYLSGYMRSGSQARPEEGIVYLRWDLDKPQTAIQWARTDSLQFVKPEQLSVYDPASGQWSKLR